VSYAAAVRPAPITWLIFALALAVGLAIAATGCGNDAKDKASGTKKPVAAKAAGTPDYAGAVATPPKDAPPLRLKDSTGRPFDISKERGKVVLVTWLYVNCPDVCPLIASNLKVARTKLGAKGRDLDIVAVSTDPKRDKPRAVSKFLAARGVTGIMRYLIGSESALGATWKNWGIVAEPAASNPELIEHSSPIYGVSASGKITTLYPANFKPDQIVHDVPLLAKQ
jgi:protein SCO1